MDDSSQSSRGSDVPPPPAGRPALHTYNNNNNNTNPFADDYNDYENHTAFAQPPAGAPPTPPPTPPSWREKYSGFVDHHGNAPVDANGDYRAGGVSSYQHSSPNDSAGESAYSGGRHAQAPTIHYEDELQTNDQGRSRDPIMASKNSFRGDATLRPNVGLTNSYENALFGWTLMELVHNLRIANLAAASLTILWVIFSWLGKLLLLQLHQLVLLCYLAVLTFALFLVEVMGFYREQLSQRGITSGGGSTHTFVMEEHVRDQLGLLYHPGGKAGYIFFLAVLCLSMHGYFLNLVAFVYCCSAFGYIYAYNTYPEFRRDYVAPAARSSETRSIWSKQAWTTTSLNGRGLAEAAARNWSSRWGLGTGPEEEPTETESFLRHNQASQNYTYV